MNKLWNLEDILELGKSTFGKEIPLNDAKKAIDYCHELAHMAFVKEDPEAQDYAEKLLYLIHVNTGFQAPLQPDLALIWQPLIRAKLKAHIKNYVNSDGITPDEMETMCLAATEATEKHVHPLIDRCGSIKDLHPMQVYTKNWYSSTHGFTNQLITLAIRASDDIKRTVFGNLAAEFSESASHPERRKVWPKALGIEYSPESAVVDPDQMTKAFGLQNLRTGLSVMQDSSYILGSFYSIESVFVGVSVRLLKAGRQLGFDNNILEHFIEHAELDPTHSLEWLETVKKSILTPQERVNVVNGTYSQLHQRTLMFQAIEKHVFNEVTIPNFESQGFPIFENSELKSVA